MKKTRNIYTIAFTVVLCCLCAVVLTGAKLVWQDRIQANEEFVKIRAVVTTMGLASVDEPRKAIVAAYNDKLKIETEGDMQMYVSREGDKITGYGIDIAGRGKYGLIKGILAIDAAKQKIVALGIYEHNETPGLGGEVASDWWLGQFPGIPLMTDGAPGIVISKTDKGPNVVSAITGASKTTYSMAKIINQTIASFLAGGQALEVLDLGLGPDAITKATPGYPKNLDLPPNLRQDVKRPPFMVPPGTVNLALKKPVTSSMEEEPYLGTLSMVTDGNKKSGEFDFVELDFDPQWVQIDLGEIKTIYAVAVWHFYKNKVIYNDVIVQIADDKDFTVNKRTIFNNDYDDSTGEGKGEDTPYGVAWWGELVDTRGENNAGTQCRYVRVWTNGGCAEEPTRFVEIAVYGKE